MILGHGDLVEKWDGVDQEAKTVLSYTGYWFIFDSHLLWLLDCSTVSGDYWIYSNTDFRAEHLVLDTN